MTASRRTAIGLVLVGLVVMPGCGGAPEEDLDRPGALEDVLESIDDLSMEELDARATRTEERIAACMSAQGFEYYVVPRVSIDDSDQRNIGGPISVDYAEEYGYGLTITPPGAHPASGGSAPLDPNTEYVASLSGTELRAYHLALYGKEPIDGEIYLSTSTDSGCWADGSRAETTKYDQLRQDFAPLVEELGRRWELIGEEPDVIESVSSWSDCMADSGYPGLTTIDEAELDILNAVIGGTQETDAVLRERELATALADATCRQQADYDDTFRRADLRLQQAFYDAHATEVQAYVAAFQELDG